MDRRHADVPREDIRSDSGFALLSCGSDQNVRALFLRGQRDALDRLRQFHLGHLVGRAEDLATLEAVAQSCTVCRLPTSAPPTGEHCLGRWLRRSVRQP
ncbi:MAG: hypothetical protein R6V02_09335 [Candidatus Aminicenantes bacterium]